jgi:ankyrin repeat protein
MKKYVMPISLVAIALVCAIAYFGWAFIRSDNLNQAARAGDLERCREQIQAGSDVNGAGMHAMKPLMSACEAGSLEVAIYLVEHGADINSHNDSGSALMWAIHSKNIELVKYLLSQGADVSWKNVMGEDALVSAREVGDPSIIDLITKAKK